MTAAAEGHPVWSIAGSRTLRLDQPHLIGVLNVTPDSFSDGGRYGSIEAAVEAAIRMTDEGASVIDVGGESVRPGATRVSAQEQVCRTVPVIEGLRRRSDVPISIDTTRASVAEAALDAGADIINDVAAGLEDDRMLPLAAQRDCGLILMHRLLPPDRDSYSDRYETAPAYDDVVFSVREFLLQRCRAAQAVGVDRSCLVIDPGLGFGKTIEQNFQLLGRMGELADPGYPVLSAASRKSFIGAVTGVERPADRLGGSLAVTILHWLAGVRLFRVHDVAAHRQAIAVIQAAHGPATQAIRAEQHPRLRRGGGVVPLSVSLDASDAKPEIEHGQSDDR